MITTAVKSDKKTLLRFYKSQRYVASFLGYDFSYFIQQDDKVVACVIVSQLSKDHPQYFMHGLVVDIKYQQKGLAAQLIKHCQQHAPLVCFVSSKLTSLYLNNNFKIASCDHLTEQLSIRFNAYRKKQPELKIFIHD